MKQELHSIKLLSIAFFTLCSSAFAQQKQISTKDLIQNKLEIVKSLPVIISWKTDDALVLTKKTPVDSSAENVLYNLKNNTESTFYKDSLADKKLIEKDNDLYYYNDNGYVRITSSPAKEVSPIFSPDSQSIAYTRNNNLFVFSLKQNKEIQLTNDGNDSLMNGYSSWVYNEEILNRPSQYRAFWWSPDSRHIAFFRTDDSPVPVFTITDGTGQHGLVEKIRYPKVGDPNPKIKIGIADVNSATITWADFNENDDQYFGMPYWSADGKTLLAQWLNRDQNLLKIYAVDPANGTKKDFYSEEQKTWIDLDDLDRVNILKNGKGYIIISDKTGWKHLYYHDSNGKLINPITSGNFTVTALSYTDEKNKLLYFVARRESSTRTDLYSVRFDGKNLKRLTSGEYHHTIQMSPSGNYFVSTYSNSSTPPKMALFTNTGKLVKELGNAKGKDFDNYTLAKTTMLSVKSDDGLFDLPSQITWPANFDSSKKYPVLISIYGGPDAGTVMDKWNYSTNQQILANEGLLQIAMDHRASGHFGKTGVNYMFHNLGYWEMKDYSTIVKHLVNKGYADSTKIGITGFSYGGYMTCYALTYGANIFTHGMAGGSVTDWSLYDSHYTEKFMGTPANNPEGYKTSSVLNYVDRYKGKLQIVHGVIDDNVHLQNSLQLISKLEDQKKEFEFMIYPGGRHGWKDNKWLHYQNLKTQFIYKNLLEKPVPTGLLK